MNKHPPVPPKQIAPVPNPALLGGISGGVRFRALEMELVREICEERAADPDGLEPAEAEALSNALLRAFGEDKEYPCLLEDPAPRHNMIPVGGPGEPDLVATENSAQGGVCRDPLPLLLRAMRMTAGSGGEADGSLTPGPSPSTQTTRLGRGENDSALLDGRGRGENDPALSGGRGTGENDERQRREASPTDDVPPIGRDHRCAAPHLLPLISNLLVEACLTPRQRQVARLMLWGWKPKEIASKLGIAASTVRKLWSRARKPLGEALVKLVLARAREEERPASTAEIREIYLEEVGRYGYHSPQHCAAGKERCKRSGVCEFALPLAHLVAAAQWKG